MSFSLFVIAFITSAPYYIVLNTTCKETFFEGHNVIRGMNFRVYR